MRHAVIRLKNETLPGVTQHSVNRGTKLYNAASAAHFPEEMMSWIARPALIRRFIAPWTSLHPGTETSTCLIPFI
jgi:hypothetical protein